MKRSKTYGLLALTAFAMAMLFGTTSASASDFRAEQSGIIWAGDAPSDHAFEFKGAGYKFANCDNDFISQELSSAEDYVTVEPNTQEETEDGTPLLPCKFLGITFYAIMGTCDYRFHPGGESLSGSMDITGCGNTLIEFNHQGCSIKVGNQQHLGSVTYKNVGTGSNRHIVATAKLSGITYTATGSGCLGPEVGTFHDGAYTGTWEISSGAGIWAEPSAPPAPTEFVAEEGPVSFSGAGVENKAIFEGFINGTVTCSNHSLSGESATAAPESITISGTYSGCKFLDQNATLSMGGCSYVLHASGGFDIVGATCASNPITVSLTGGGCTATIGPKTGSSGRTYTNAGSGKLRSVTTGGSAPGLPVTVKGEACVVEGTFTNGKYKAVDRFTATNSLGQPQGVWVE